ncbi:MAG: isoaspartyl peptidase/L-asparaginase, partial [Pyrinomonadaceae bacterium]
ARLIEKEVGSETNPKSKIQNPKSLGTVGAVACDANGNLAAATSTGGMTNKKFGRIGDTPLIGAGTYADNQTCAVSCTGHGEFFMCGVTAYDAAARLKYKNLSLENAANEAIKYLTEIGGEGGLIAVDAFGNVAMPFNSEGMYRGLVTADGEMSVEIYG